MPIGFLLLLVSFVHPVVSLDNGLALTPPMGWMSWAKFMCDIDCAHRPFSCISEQLYMNMADILGRALEGLHGKGLKLGIYEDYGTKTCEGYPGSFGFLQIDAHTFADWQVDYLKLDGCNIALDKMPIGYPQMSGFLNHTGRPIVYSCSWPAYLIDRPDKVDYSVIGRFCNLWRNFDDVAISWKSIIGIIDYYDANQDKLIVASGPGRWNDPDMIVVGNSELTLDESRSQMSIWSMWSAPLIMSNDLRLVAPMYKNILLNKLVIAVDQDPLGRMARLVTKKDQVSVYVKPVIPVDNRLNLFSYAIVLFNRDSLHSTWTSVLLSDLNLTNPSGYQVHDLWTDTQLGRYRPQDIYTGRVPPSGVSMVKATLVPWYRSSVDQEL